MREVLLGDRQYQLEETWDYIIKCPSLYVCHSAAREQLTSESTHSNDSLAQRFESVSPTMDPAGKTLVEIASVSQRLFNKLVKYAGGKTIECFQLEKIVVASGTILETLNGALFLQNGTIDDRLKDWLSGNEPKTCLDVLTRMDALLSPTVGQGHGVKNFFRSSPSLLTNDKSIEAIRVFWKHEGYFHFLLTTEVW